MNQLIDPRELQLMAHFYEEVRAARLQNLQGSARNPVTGKPLVRGVRPLDGIPPNNRGASIVLTAGENNRSILQVRPTSEDVVAEMLTISIGAQPVDTSFVVGQFNPPNGAQIQGNLQWGIGQAGFQAFFDCYRGTTISVPASFLSLSASYQGQIVPPDNPPFQVSAGVGYGSYYNRSAPARFTSHVGSFPPPPGTITTQIPPFAVAFTLQTEVGSLPVVPPDISIVVTDSVSNEVSSFQYTNPTNTANHQEQQFPLFNGAERIILFNNAAFSPGRVRIIYTLAL